MHNVVTLAMREFRAYLRSPLGYSLLEVRNKLLESYQELMRLQV